MATKKISLEEFIAEERARLDRFEAMWRAEQAADGKSRWPDKLPAGEWDEQLMNFEA